MFGRATIRLGIGPHSSSVYVTCGITNDVVFSHNEEYFAFAVVRGEVCYPRLPSLSYISFYFLCFFVYLFVFYWLLL